jgi:hypothetical protein
MGVLMKRAYITHVTENYFQVARNLALSIRKFSDIPILIYGINCRENVNPFEDITEVHLIHIDLPIDSLRPEDFGTQSDGNFYIERKSPRIYQILCAKTVAIEKALESGVEEVCYLDSDCLGTPIVDELFDWIPLVKNYPLCSEGIHQYMIMIESGKERGNPFEGCWPMADHTKTLEWPLMQFLQMFPDSRGTYRTTNVILATPDCLSFVKMWRELCFMLPKLNLDLNYYAAYHEETIYNVLSWKKTNEGLPLCYINLRDGLETTVHFYEQGQPGFSSWMTEENPDPSLCFYKIPEEKRSIKVLHGEKRESECSKITDYLEKLQKSNYFQNF